jgi:hypothetical protein
MWLHSLELSAGRHGETQIRSYQILDRRASCMLSPCGTGKVMCMNLDMTKR